MIIITELMLSVEQVHIDRLTNSVEVYATLEKYLRRDDMQDKKLDLV